MSSIEDSASLVRPTIPMRYLVEMARRSGVSRARVSRALARASLPNDALRSPELRASIVQLELYYLALRREADDEGFGYFERKIPPGSYATVIRFMSDCVDVRAALDVAARFYRLFDRHQYWHFDLGRHSTLRLEPRDRDQAHSIFFVHTMLISPWRTAAWLSGRAAPVQAIRLPSHFREFAGETAYLFGREPIFESGAPSLTLTAEFFERRIVREPQDADLFVTTSLRSQVLAPEPTALENEIRALFFEARPVGNISLPHAARRLALSRASLARKLALAGLSFQRIKDEVRRDHAIALLTQTSQPIALVAERVGYSAPSAFQRAFREWTGLSPGSIRKRR